jgi:eukaryotic-like serine/threonine-protein kinase
MERYAAAGFEFMVGGTLADRLERGPRPVEAVLELGVALAGAVGALHRTGLLHRDIKPSNIGFTAAGAPKLMDFGLARVLAGAAADGASVRPGLRLSTRSLADGGASRDRLSTRQTLTGEDNLIGTPLYLPPELIRGQAPDASTDLWSLALVLHECIAGRNPFEARNLPLTLVRILQAAPPDIRQFAPATPPAVAAFLRDALGVQPEGRPRTATEFERRLASATVVAV